MCVCVCVCGWCVGVGGWCVYVCMVWVCACVCVCVCGVCVCGGRPVCVGVCIGFVRVMAVWCGRCGDSLCLLHLFWLFLIVIVIVIVYLTLARDNHVVSQVSCDPVQRA